MDQIEDILVSERLSNVARHEVEGRPEQPSQNALHDFFVFFSTERQRIDVADLVLQSFDLPQNILLLRVVLRLRGVVQNVPNVTRPTLLSLFCRFNRDLDLNKYWPHVDEIKKHCLWSNGP